MRFLKESLLSFFVAGAVLALYSVAAVAALFGLRGFPRGTHQRHYTILKSQRA
jgi:hypothetical protein